MKASLRRPAALAALLFLVVATFYAVTFSFRNLTDTNLNSLQTRSLVLHGDVDLARYGAHARGFVVPHGPHRYSIYGIGVSLVAAPFYLPLVHTGASDAFLQGSVAVVAVAAAMVIFFFLMQRLASTAVAAAATVVLAFGTTFWPLASTALYQHGPAALFQVIGLSALFSKKPRAPAVAGLGFAAAAFIRPPMIIGYGLIGLFYLSQGRKPVAQYALGSVLPFGAAIVQNRWIWGTWLTGGYSFAGVGFHADVPRALRGLLVGWWRGLFVYSPVLVAGFAGVVMCLRRPWGFVRSRLAVLGIASVITVVFYSRWSTWWGGLNQYGYRYLLDVVPFLVLIGAWAVSRSEVLRKISIPLAVLSLMNMAFGAEPNNFAWDAVRFPRRFVDASIGQAWIVFVHRPLGSLARLAGVAAIAALLYAAAEHLRETRPAEPLFATAA
jgi:hypothetical protein